MGQNKLEDLKLLTPILVNRRAGGLSAVVNTAGAQQARIRCIHGPATTKIIYRVRHATASGITYASATAFDPPIILSSVTSGTRAVELTELHKVGPFLRVVQSSVTTSAVGGTEVDLVANRAVPPASRGFLSVTSQAK
jgi:hypothetical protein